MIPRVLIQKQDICQPNSWVVLGTTWAQNAVSTSSQIYIASPKQAYSSIALDSNQKWTGTIGDNSNCDPQASSVICNGPLLPDETYNVWVAGWTESGKIVVSQKLSDLKTTKGEMKVYSYVPKWKLF